MIANETLGLAVMLRSFTRPRALFRLMSSPRMSNQTGVTWGDPSFMLVPRNAKARFSSSNKSRCESGMIEVMFIPPSVYLPGKNKLPDQDPSQRNKSCSRGRSSSVSAPSRNAYGKPRTCTTGVPSAACPIIAEAAAAISSAKPTTVTLSFSPCRSS